MYAAAAWLKASMIMVAFATLALDAAAGEDSKSPQTVIDSVRHIRKVSSPLIDLDDPARPTRFTKADSYTYLWMGWPIAPLRSAKPAMLNEEFGHICADRGGKYNGSYCISDADPDLVQFVAKQGKISGDFTVEVVEPVTMPPSREYREIVAQTGFQTSREQAARETAAQRLAAINQEKLGQRGTPICKQMPGYKLIGFVEDTNQDRSWCPLGMLLACPPALSISI